jgi:hypothetical protein
MVVAWSDMIPMAVFSLLSGFLSEALMFATGRFAYLSSSHSCAISLSSEGFFY